MYCPKCGQLVAENTRFCSRCGLSVSEVSEWLHRGGSLAVREQAPLKILSPRRKGMRLGAKMMFWGGIAFPLFLALSIAVDEPFPLFIPFIVVLAGLSILLYSRLFGEDIPPYINPQAQDPRFGTAPGFGALPAGSDAGIINAGRRQARTAEIAQPPSVTEQTTKLLDSE